MMRLMKRSGIIFMFVMALVLMSDTTANAEEWSEWSTTKPGDGYVTEAKTQYRYKSKKVIRATSQPATPAGYSYSSSVYTGTYTAWGSWTGYGTTVRTASTLMDVSTCTGYRYYAFVCKNCGTHDPYAGACSACGGSVYWVEQWGTCSGYAYGPGYQKFDSNKGRINWLNGKWWYFELNGRSNGQGGYGQPTTTLYRYRTRQQYIDYTYWMTNYTSWSFTAETASSDKLVETRTVYRYKIEKPANDPQESPENNVVTKKTQKITASSKTVTIGAKPFNLNAKASGGGKLSYKSGNKKVATVSSTGKVTVKACGKATITIKAASTGKYKSATKKITVTVKPKKSQKITASSKKVTYGSKSFSLNAKTNGGGKLSYKSGNKKVATVSSKGRITVKGYGKATITITAAAKGNYKKATKKITITVVPKKMTLSKVTSPSRRRLSISWEKNSTVSGYEVLLSANKNFKTETYQRKFSKGTGKTTLTGLKSNKLFYVKVRSYKKVDGKTYYGSWSSIKKVEIK